MSSQFGNTSLSWAGSTQTGLNTGPYQVAQYFSGFPGGLVTGIHCYVSAWTSTTNMELCVWDASGNLLVTSGTIAVPAAGTGVGAQAWQYAAVNSGVVAGGIYIGWWRDPHGSHNWSHASAGSYVQNNNTSAGTLSGFSYQTNSGSIGAYIDYVQGGIKEWNGSTWNRYAVKSYQSGAWHQYALKQWNGSTWTRYA